MNLYQFSEPQILAFILVMIRISAFFILFPLFESGSVPGQAKILLSLLVSFVMFPTIQFASFEPITEMFTILVIKEMFIGIFIAFVAKLFFFALNIAGELITAAVGLSSSQVFNPMFGSSTFVLERFELYIGTLLFLAFNGHHVFIKGLAQSFSLIPVGDASLNLLVIKDFALFAEQIFIIGIQLSAPVMGAVFFLNIGMGIIGRAVPQVNVLVTSWSLNILVGLSILIFSLPLMILAMKDSFNVVAEFLFKAMKTL